MSRPLYKESSTVQRVAHSTNCRLRPDPKGHVRNDNPCLLFLSVFFFKAGNVLGLGVGLGLGMGWVLGLGWGLGVGLGPGAGLVLYVLA